MSKSKIFTDFLPAEREDFSTLILQNNKFNDIEKLKKYFDAIPDFFMVLNDKRQVIFANLSLLNYLNKDKLQNIIGERPGELFGCQHAFESEGGCGTTKFCSTCGAAKAIIASLKGKQDVEECRINKSNNDALDLRVWTTPETIDKEDFVILSIQDISNEKRRAALERIFFHDIINTAGGLKGFAELIRDYPEEVNEFKDILYNLTNKLIEEINTQKQLSAAEKGELELNLTNINSSEIIDYVVNLYRNHDVAENKHLKVSENTQSINLVSDQVLLGRVLGNMVKNALEASKEGHTVTIGSIFDNGNIVFFVNNPTVMPETIQLQVFQRSFSTKGNGRGLGTYSMKLLAEKYLNGKMSFSSNDKDGTTFYAIFKNSDDI